MCHLHRSCMPLLSCCSQSSAGAGQGRELKPRRGRHQEPDSFDPCLERSWNSGLVQERQGLLCTAECAGKALPGLLPATGAPCFARRVPDLWVVSVLGDPLSSSRRCLVSGAGTYPGLGTGQRRCLALLCVGQTSLQHRQVPGHSRDLQHPSGPSPGQPLLCSAWRGSPGSAGGPARSAMGHRGSATLSLSALTWRFLSCRHCRAAVPECVFPDPGPWHRDSLLAGTGTSLLSRAAVGSLWVQS